MLHIEVALDGTGHFITIQEAINSIPYNVEAVITLKPGKYREKIFCEKRKLILQGSGTTHTYIIWQDGAHNLHQDGRKTGTFRSYTAFFGGEHITVRDLTIENAAGDGRVVGQAMAAYVDAEKVFFENVYLISCQDTLFCAPLPQQEREKNGFLGPRAYSSRRKTKQYYKNCFISGDIDFIFGGADAVFEMCKIFSKNRGEKINGYVSAPCGGASDLGFVFLSCHFDSDCSLDSVYLGRPWRSHGKTSLLKCTLEEHIIPTGWSGWAGANVPEPEAFFAEYECTGRGAHGTRVSWAHKMTKDEAEILLAQVNTLRRSVIGHGAMLFT